MPRLETCSCCVLPAAGYNVSPALWLVAVVSTGRGAGSLTCRVYRGALYSNYCAPRLSGSCVLLGPGATRATMDLRLGCCIPNLHLTVLFGGTTSTIADLVGNYHGSCSDENRRPQPARARGGKWLPFEISELLLNLLAGGALGGTARVPRWRFRAHGRARELLTTSWVGLHFPRRLGCEVGPSPGAWKLAPSMWEPGGRSRGQRLRLPPGTWRKG